MYWINVYKDKDGYPTLFQGDTHRSKYDAVMEAYDNTHFHKQYYLYSIEVTEAPTQKGMKFQVVNFENEGLLDWFATQLRDREFG